MAATKPRRRITAGNDEEDVSPAGQGVVRTEDVPDKMVTVRIERDFTLTGDDHKPIQYKAGVDEMPLSHANHWFAKNAGGVTLYVGRRPRVSDAGEQKPVVEPTMPPKGDPSKMPELSADMRLGNDPHVIQTQGA